MADANIDVRVNVSSDSKATKAEIEGLTKALEGMKKRSNETRENMEKLAQVGTKLALAGTAITAPFALALKKYTDAAKETEPTSKRILAAMQSMEKSQERIGRVTAELVLPALESMARIIEKVAAFVEKNPDAVKAALGIGGSLIVLGGIVTTTAQIVSTIATVQGLLASLGIANLGAGGGIAAAGGAAAAGGGAGIAAMVPQVVAALIAAGAIALIVDQIARYIAGIGLVDMFKSIMEFGSRLGEVFSGKIKFNDLAAEIIKKSQTPKTKTTTTNPFYGMGAGGTTGTAAKVESEYKKVENAALQHAQTVTQIETQVYQQRTQIAANWALFEGKTYQEIIQIQRDSFEKQLKDWIENQKAGTKAQTGYQKAVADYTVGFYNELNRQMVQFREALGIVFQKAASGQVLSRASGGYAGYGLYTLGEVGREFVMSANTTRAAERAMGGALTQQNVNSMMTNNINLSNGVTVAQARRMMKGNNKLIMQSLLSM